MSKTEMKCPRCNTTHLDVIGCPPKGTKSTGTKTMTQHTPEHVHNPTAPCSCTIQHGLAGERIVYCQAHAAAPEMAHELKIMVQRYEALCALTKSTGDIANTKNARALLAKIEGGK